MILDNLQDLGAWLKSLREQKGITGYQIERKHGVFLHSMKAIETGDKNYNIATLQKYCDAIGVDIVLKERE